MGRADKTAIRSGRVARSDFTSDTEATPMTKVPPYHFVSRMPSR